MLITGDIFAQNARFTTSGSIEYEKSANTFAILQKMYADDMNDGFLQQAFEQYKKTQPQFRMLKSTLTFGYNKTLFTPTVTESIASDFFNMPMAEQNNIVYADMASNTSTTQKTVFEQTFLVKDSIRKIKWKITDETRQIAGYNCRRANGLVMDSVYVVAFYTDQIHISGGPESFGGLPGMILGIAVPHENVSWFATKVTDSSIPENAITPPKKGKPVTYKGLMETLKPVMKNWGNEAQVYLKAFML
jgi:GLPGLI family protein